MSGLPTIAELSQSLRSRKLSSLELIDDCLARIDLSHPYWREQGPGAWLRVHRRHGALRTLCNLYEDRLLSADAVVRGLGGFTVAPMATELCEQESARKPPI